MAVKMSIAVRNSMLNGLETAIGTGAVLKLRTGAPPTNIADADSGSVVATITLPTDWMDDAASGSKAKLGTWSATGANVPGGTAEHFRIYASDGTTQHIQGTVTISGGGGDMTLDNNVITANQTVTIATFTLTGGNA